MQQLAVALSFEERSPSSRDTSARATFLDLSAALYDFELTYEVAVIASQPAYTTYDFSNFFRRGRNRPIPRTEMLQVSTLSYESPFHVLGVIPRSLLGVKLIELLVDAIETVYTAPVRIRVSKKRLQVEETKLDSELLRERWALEQLAKQVERQRLQLERVEIIELPAPTGHEDEGGHELPQ